MIRTYKKLGRVRKEPQMQPELYRWEEILADQLAPPPNAHVSVLPSKNIILARTTARLFCKSFLPGKNHISS
jgi:hypothetical protein